MLRFKKQLNTEVAIISSIIVFAFILFALWQQIDAARSSARLLKKAQSLVNQRRYYEALSCLNAMAGKERNNPMVYIERGYAYINLGKLQKAVEDYNAAIQLSPKSYLAYSYRAEAYGRLGQYQAQIDDLTSAIKIEPKIAELYAKRAQAYYELGQLQNAIADCSRANSISPTLSDAYFTAANAYEELGLYDQAIEPRTKLIELRNEAFDWSNRATDYEFLGKYDVAQTDRQRANKVASPTERGEMQLASPLIDFDHPSSETPKDKIDKQLKKDSVVLSFHYDTDGHLCVPVKVNGRPLQFMLDTGSAESDLWKRVTPGIAILEKAQVQWTKANGEVGLIGWFRAKDFKLGNLTLPNVAMEVDEGLAGNKSLSGFLGGNILENFVVTVDYRNKQVILGNSSEAVKSKKAIVVPMRLHKHLPYCSVRLDGELDIMALLDTGCPGNVSADSLLKPILKEEMTFKEHTSGPWLGNLNMESVRINRLELNASHIESLVFDVFPAAEAPVAAKRITLGNSFLSGFKTVTFDYPHRLIIFEPTDDAAPSAPSSYSLDRYYFYHKDWQHAVNAFSHSMILDNEF
jgi:tetratricopeptide (TPR) repeat protein